MPKKQKKVKNNQTFGQRLRLLREKADLSQGELSKKLGYKTNASISHIEKGRSTLDNIALAKLVGILKEADLHWLITGKYNKTTLKLIDILAPCITPYIDGLKQQIKDADSEILRLSFGLTFRDEDNYKSLKEAEKKREGLRNEHDLVLSILYEITKQP